MKTKYLRMANRLGVSGWGLVLIFALTVGVWGKPAFIFLSGAAVVFALALICYDLSNRAAVVENEESENATNPVDSGVCR